MEDVLAGELCGLSEMYEWAVDSLVVGVLVAQLLKGESVAYFRAVAGGVEEGEVVEFVRTAGDGITVVACPDVIDL